MAEDRPPSRRPRRIPVAKPWFDQEEERRIVEVLRSGWVTQGQQVVELEHRVAEIVGSAHAVAVSSSIASPRSSARRMPLP